MKQLSIASNLTLPVDAVTQTFAILAKRGVGKTYCLLVMAEEMLKAGFPIVVADPVGVCWGLRANAAGTGPGYGIYVFGGDHGDVPLEPTGGQLVADLVVDQRVSLVLDMSLMRKAEQVRFMADFAGRLYHRNRDPLHLFLDEADEFAPQKPGKDQLRMLGAIEDVVRRGRSRGVGITMATQRSAVLNKNVLTQIEVLVAMRTPAPQDQAAIDAWIKVHGTPEQRDEMMGSLASLDVGTAWFWSPGWLDLFRKVKVRKRTTFDSSATPKVGQRRVATPKKMAAVDLEAVKSAMADTIERAKADDPKELRKQIAELKKQIGQLEKRPPTAPARETIKKIEVPVLTDKERKAIEKLVDKLTAAAVKIDLMTPAMTISRALEKIPVRVRDTDWKTRELAKPVVRPVPAPRQPAPPREPRRQAPVNTSDPSEHKITGGALRMIHVLVSQHPMRLTESQWATLSKLKRSGGTWGTYKSQLRVAGLFEEGRDGLIGSTELAIEQYADSAPSTPETPEERIAMWRSRFKGGALRMFDVLVEKYPDSMSREELAEATNLTSNAGTFGTYLSQLRSNELIEVHGDEVQASESLFI